MHKDLKDTDVKNGVSCHDTNTVKIAPDVKYKVVALVGQPNAGKTTLFNALTGSNFKTSNYPGATVEYSVGNLISNNGFNALVIDSPGIISLTPNSPDEDVTVNALFNHPKFGLPDVVVITADSTQLSRQLYLVKQVIDSGFKVVVALTMNDLLNKKDLEISSSVLEEILGTPVVKIDGRKGKGVKELIHKITELYKQNHADDYKEKIKKPEFPTEETIKNLYKFTEYTEHRVMQKVNGQIDIEQINRDAFKSFSKTPDENTVKLDKIFLHPLWGIIIFIISMGIIFTSIFWLARPLMDLIDSGFSTLSVYVAAELPQGTWYNDLITKGLINGVGSVLLFLPQIVILFLFLGVLEDTGYLARAAMLIDKPLSKFGLNGRSFVPMISGICLRNPRYNGCKDYNKPQRKISHNTYYTADELQRKASRLCFAACFPCTA